MAMSFILLMTMWFGITAGLFGLILLAGWCAMKLDESGFDAVKITTIPMDASALKNVEKCERCGGLFETSYMKVVDIETYDYMGENSKRKVYYCEDDKPNFKKIWNGSIATVYYDEVSVEPVYGEQKKVEKKTK